MASREVEDSAASYDENEFMEFRRGFDNSHDNRMMTGSYSRYLMTTGLLSEPLFMESFFGSLPTLGFALSSVERSQQQQQQRQHARNYSPQRRLYERNQRTYSPSGKHNAHKTSANNRYQTTNSNNNQEKKSTLARENGKFDGVHDNTHAFTGTMNSTLPREMDLLASDTLHALNTDRATRRINRKLVNRESEPYEVDYVYYNHNSKGCFIPREPVNKNALLLHYDDLYDFGDGTRFAVERKHSSEDSHSAIHNPHAAPPKTFAETQHLLHRNYYKSNTNTASHLLHAYDNEKCNDCEEVKTTEELINASQPQHAQSLRTATSIDPNKLHCSQFRSVKTIEDVLASPSITPAAYAKREATLHHIKRAVNDGKVNINELAPAMKEMLELANEINNDTRADATNENTSARRTKENNDVEHEVSRLQYSKPFTRTTTPSVYVH